jgi:Undecaprenyl-phosphate galactose phosphotransferase WbaP
MKKILKIILLLVFDLSAFYLSLYLAFLTRKFISVSILKDINYNYTFNYLLSFWWIPIIVLFFLWYEKLYTKNYPFWDEIKQIIKAISFSIIFIFFILSLTKQAHLVSRLTIIFLYFYSIIFFPLFRHFGKKILFSFYRNPILIIGAGETGKSVAKSIIEDPHLDVEIKGFLDDNKEGYIEINNKKYPILGKVYNIEHLNEIDTVIIAMPSLNSNNLNDLINKIHRHTKNVFTVPVLNNIGLLNSEIYNLFNEKMFLLKIENRLESSINQAIKRFFDLTLSVLMLPILLPTILIIGILIKLDSKGPIFYTQERVGKNGKKFKVIKFRSMYTNADEVLKMALEEDPKLREEYEKYFKIKNDPRATKVGRFLRKTSLDELPQIFNVLKGEMSLVGPRPVTTEEIVKYYKDYVIYYYEVLPGITGLWQISGRSDTSYDERVELDIWYVKNWNLWLDIVILIKTIKVVLKREGAY